VARQFAKAMGRNREYDDVAVANDLLGGLGPRTRREHVDGEGDVVGRSRAGDRDVIAGCDGGTGERRTELARADDAEAQIVGLGRGRRLCGELDCSRHRQPSTATTGSGAAASSSRTWGITSRP